MNKNLMIIILVIIVIGIISVIAFSIPPSDNSLFEESQNIEAVKVFLEKYPNPKTIIEENPIRSIRYVHETTSTDFLQHPYVFIKMFEDDITDQIILECWDGKERHTVIGNENIVAYLQKNGCLGY